MDALVGRSIKLVEEKKRKSVPWKLDEPWTQPYYVHDGKAWVAKKAKAVPAQSDQTITKLALHSWNIDFMLPFPDSRMKTAIEHLKNSVIASYDPSTATAIYLQECVETDIQLIANHPWVQERFALSDIDISNWMSGHYGTITLLDRRLPIVSSFRVHYSATRMERDVLITDIILGNRTVRLCNSHLESLALEPPYRIPQMKLIASYMHDDGIDAAIAAGDFNAIQPFDATLHNDNGLSDAYLEQGGIEADSAGHTWGQQAATVQRERFGTSRMDKVYYTPTQALKLLAFATFGADIVLDNAVEAEELVKLGFEKPWVTDHLGVKAVFEVADVQLPSL